MLSLAHTPTAVAADLTVKAPAAPDASYNWTGAYAGGHLGDAGGSSNWNAGPGVSGSLNILQPINVFGETGSLFAGLQAGYDKMFANRFLVGVVADVSFPASSLNKISVGGSSNLVSASGLDVYSDQVLAFGTLRGRVGYAPGNWLFYATGGVAASYDQMSLASAIETPQLFRLGWAAGIGTEVAIGNSWSASLEYLHTSYGLASVAFPSTGLQFSSNLQTDEVRFGLNYHFREGSKAESESSAISPDLISIHGQATLTWQGYPTFRSPYAGQNSLPGNGSGGQTFDTTLFAGIKLWQGAEFWFNPEIDQGFGIGNTHGFAGYTSGESSKLGAGYPYARIQRAFLRQTINFGGEVETVDEDINQFAGKHSTDRLVLTVGRVGVADIFDTNKYANNPKVDFLNWSLINTGTFDYAADAWGSTYGGAAELYFGHWTVRAGIFDVSATPADGNSPLAYALDPSFSQYQAVAEVERRYQLWGQPGAIKVTGFFSSGQAGTYADAIAQALATNQPADLTTVRGATNRPGISMNLQQQINDSIGVFMRAGWADGNIEPRDFADIDRTIAGGTAIAGKSWGRPDDTIGIAGVVNGISAAHAAFLAAGGLGITIGDGQLTTYRPEQIFETYYSYALSRNTRLTLDYQRVANPGYNADRGPVNAVAARLHGQF